MSRRLGRGAVRALVRGALLLACAGSAAAQEAEADSSSAAAGGGLSGLSAAMERRDEADLPAAETATASGPFITSLKVTPTAGVKANVRQNTYYGENAVMLLMRGGATFSQDLSWSYDQYRKQNKKVDRRTAKFGYGFGQLLPLMVRLDGSWDWSEDRTVNTAGFSNLFAKDDRSLRLSASKMKLRRGALIHSMRLGAAYEDRQSENQGTPSNSSEVSGDLGVQTGWEITSGLVLAGRAYGSSASGERTLGRTDSPSSAQGDSLGIGLYFEGGRAGGMVQVTRANFERRYLDFRKNANGLIDTVGAAEDLKVVQELETRDAVALEYESLLVTPLATFRSSASRTTDDLQYAVNGQGLKERQVDVFGVGMGVMAGVDSVNISYDYGWKWDDQRIQDATANRGRQYNKSRELELLWFRPFFAGTDFRLRAFRSLSQDIAQFVHNDNDKDRLQNDFSVSLERRWTGRFATSLVYAFRSAEDRSIRETKSSNNNIKSSYEIAPDYTWYVAPWLTWKQIYKVYIQYTDYVYSQLESVNRDDNYNKRGSLTTQVTLEPSSRLEIVVRHDYNKKFNATRVAEGQREGRFYARDLNQTISKLDLGITYKIRPGVTIEAATYRTRDVRENFRGGAVLSETVDRSGEVWVGTKVKHKWSKGPELSAMVKKYNAFGPAVTESSSDYWEADTWVKWEF